MNGTAAHAGPSRVVLLGASGFISQALARALQARAIDTFAVGSAQVDLTEVGAAQQIRTLLKPSDSIVMLAAITPEKGRGADVLTRNAAMMAQVCAAIGAVGCAHFVYFSSDAVYDSAVSRVSEETPPSPQTLYGAMHHSRELMARELGVPLLVLRPTGVYGPGDTHNSYGPNRFARMLHDRGAITLFGGGEELRDHIHIDDVAELTLRFLVGRTTGTFNLVTGASRSFRDVADAMAAHRPGARVIEIARASAITHRHYDITRLIKQFPGFRFVPVEEGAIRANLIHKEFGDG